MRCAAILLAVLASGFAVGCGESDVGKPKLTEATPAVEALVRACEPSTLTAFSDVGNGSYGTTSEWVGLCEDGKVVEVED